MLLDIFWIVKSFWYRKRYGYGNHNQTNLTTNSTKADGVHVPPPCCFKPLTFASVCVSLVPLSNPKLTAMAAQPWGQPGQPDMQGQQGQVVVVQKTGNCPSCGTGLVSPEFTCCGIALAIIFFPWGLCCCYMMRERKCGSCGYTMA